MSRIIVAIGGGENGRCLDDGTFLPYETETIDQEIIKFAQKEHPNFLFIDHAMESLEIQESYFKTMQKIYGEKFGCHCQDLKSNELNDVKKVKEKVAWADIIYEGGGDTKFMIKLWQDTGFDKVLYEAWNQGKVISGISAGAVCFFKSCNSETDSNSTVETFEIVDCLNWFNAFMTPHCNEKGRYESTKEQLKTNHEIGLMLSNRSALAIVDNKYKVILSEDSSFSPYVIKAYWDQGKYKEARLDNTLEYKSLEELLSKNLN